MPGSSSMIRIVLTACPPSRGPRGQVDEEGGARPGRALDPHVAAVVEDDAPHDGQAQPRPALLGGEVGVEDALPSFSSMPVPVSLTAIRQSTPGLPWTPRRRRTVRLPAAGHGLHRVGEEVGERLADLRAVHGQHQVERGTSCRSTCHGPEAVRVRRGHLAQQLAQAHRSRVGSGRRANSLNSPRRRSSASTSRMMAAVEEKRTLSNSPVTTAGGPPACSEVRGAYSPCFFRMRWAESLIGVSGFLISWARRRAISCHAVMRSACTACAASRRARRPWTLNESARRRDLVARRREDAEAEVPLGHPPGGLLQVHDGADDPVGQQQAHQDVTRKIGKAEQEEEGRPARTGTARL